MWILAFSRSISFSESMASGGQPSGFGRGGRGAALLQALQKPPRRPGETSPANSQASSVQTASRVSDSGATLTEKK